MQAEATKVSEFWAHLEIIGVILVPMFGIWWDNRRQRQGEFREAEKLQGARHQENRDRLMAIETKIEPMWNWFNRSNR